MFYWFIFIPAFIISAIIVLLSLKQLSKAKFKKFINRRYISGVCITIVIIITILAVLINMFVTSRYYPVDKLIGEWALGEEHRPLLVYYENYDETVEIIALTIMFDETYGRHSILFSANEYSYNFHWILEYDRAKEEITITDFSSPDGWELILKLDIEEIGTDVTMTMHYVNDTNFHYFNATSFDGSTWRKL
jgi:hypothetical protein